MSIYKKWSWFFFAFSMSSLFAEQGFVLPEKWEIILPEKPTATEVFAATELRDYLTQLPAGGEANSIYRIVISGRGTNDQIADQANGDAGFDNYRVVVTPHQAELRGINDRGALYATYDFLGLFGFRWLMPGPLGEIGANTRTILPQDRTEKPAFFVREICASGPESWSKEDQIDWMVKNRINRDFNSRREPAWLKRGSSPLWQWIAHNYKFVLPEEGNYFENYPEWFALYKGERVPLGDEKGNICTTHPGLIAHFVSFIRNWFNQNPQGTTFPLSPPDGAIRWCECPNCLALGGRNFTPGPEGSMSLRQIRFVQTIAEELQKTHPDKKILLLAYQNFVDPVPGENLPENVLVQIVNYGAFGQPVTSPLNEVQRKRIEGWQAIASKNSPSLGVWDYCLLQVDNLSGGRLVPIPIVRALHENIRFLHAAGGGIFFTQAGPIQESNPFAFYAAARWAWNPEVSREVLLQEFCDAFYGDASSSMYQFWSRLEEAAAAAEWNPSVWPEITLPSAKVFTPEVLRELDELLSVAKAAVAEGSDWASRIALASRSMDYVANSVAQSVPWRLVRGKNSYLINPEGGRAAEFRVRGLRAEQKNSSDPDGSFQRLIFRIKPREAAIHVIENTSLQVAVIPEIGGRIIRMRDKESGWNFLDEPSSDLILDNPSTAYVHYGGYEEYSGRAFAAPGWETPFRWKQGTDQLVLKAKVGELEILRTLALDPRKPLVHVTSNQSGGTSDGVLRGHPVFRMPDHIDSLVLVWKTKEGDVRQQPLVQSSPQDIAGVWAVYSPKLQALLVHRFDPNQAKPHLHTDTKNQTFNLELISSNQPAPVLEQSFEILKGELSQLLSKL